MTTWLRRIDRAIALVSDGLCSLLLVGLTLVVLYSVVMRYAFAQPPFWSDVVSMFANVGLILVGISLAVRRRELIAMQALYDRISPLLGLVLDAVWNALILVFGLIFAWYGWQAAMAVPGFYWELGMLPQRYPMMIMPVSGVLLVIACTGVLVQDVRRLHELRSAATGADDESEEPTASARDGRE